MPARLAFTAAAYGAGYGIFPICLDHSSRHLPLRPHRENRPLRHAAAKPHRHHRRQPPATCSSSPSRSARSLKAPPDSARPSPSAPPSSSVSASVPFKPPDSRCSPTPRRSHSAPWAFRIVALHGVTGIDLLRPHPHHRRHPRALRPAHSLLAHLGLRGLPRHDRNLAGDPRLPASPSATAQYAHGRL